MLYIEISIYRFLLKELEQIVGGSVDFLMTTVIAGSFPTYHLSINEKVLTKSIKKKHFCLNDKIYPLRTASFKL